MSKPFHVIATPDENGYTVTIPENPNVSARCADAAGVDKAEQDKTIEEIQKATAGV
ncbi:MAG: hypothetical protein J6A79_08765 [Clostridia bacterium]|nr:hypothetical protein [Clostridia bacterium]